MQDEAGHGLYLYSAAETLGTSREEMIEALHSGKAKYSTIFNYPTLTWADIGAIGWLVDGAAIMNQVPLQRTSYGPYARAMVRVCKEESFHQRQGYEIMMHMAAGTAEQKRMAQDALEPLVVAVADDVRPAPTTTAPTPPSRCAGGSSATPMTSSARSSSTSPCRRPTRSASTVPDPDLRWNEAKGGYDFGEVDWEEFYAVVKGEGPVAKERMKARRDAWEQQCLGARGGRGLCRRSRRRKAEAAMSKDWPLWEVFVRAKGGMSHRHVGSVHAPDAEIALRHARDTYTRRMEGVSLWVVPSASITASDPADDAAMFDPGRGQDLPPPDLLRHPRRREAYLMASLPPIDVPEGATGEGAFDAPVEDDHAACCSRLCCGSATTA